MANLNKILKDQGLDDIDGPVRNQLLLSVWNKKDNNRITFFQMLPDLYASPYVLKKYVAPALFVDYSAKRDYDIGIGITALEELLSKLNLGNLGLNVKIKGGKNVSIAFNDAQLTEYPHADFSNYFYQKDGGFVSSNPEIIDQANQNNLILISGILYAKNFEAHIKTDTDVDVNLGLELTELAKGKIDFSLKNSKDLVMKSNKGEEIPIAVKAFRLNFFKGKYKSAKLVTDHRNWY